MNSAHFCEGSFSPLRSCLINVNSVDESMYNFTVVHSNDLKFGILLLHSYTVAENEPIKKIFFFINFFKIWLANYNS